MLRFVKTFVLALALLVMPSVERVDAMVDAQQGPPGNRVYVPLAGRPQGALPETSVVGRWEVEDCWPSNPDCFDWIQTFNADGTFSYADQNGNVGGSGSWVQNGEAIEWTFTTTNPVKVRYSGILRDDEMAGQARTTSGQQGAWNGGRLPAPGVLPVPPANASAIGRWAIQFALKATAIAAIIMPLLSKRTARIPPTARPVSNAVGGRRTATLSNG